METVNVKMFKTKDGMLFKTKEQARDHEKELPYEEFIEGLKRPKPSGTIYSNDQSDYMYSQIGVLRYFLKHHGKSIKNFLNRILK